MVRTFLWASCSQVPLIPCFERPSRAVVNPPLLVLNEPENSLHPDLLAPLARLIAAVADRTRVWVVAHAECLITVLANTPGCTLQRLERAAWRWPA